MGTRAKTEAAWWQTESKRSYKESVDMDVPVERFLECPKCAGVMIQRSVSQVEVDECQRCHGIFLDIGELDVIVAEVSFGPFNKRRRAKS